MKSGDRCPVCDRGILELVKADDPDDEYPNGGRYEDYLYCMICESFFEIMK